MLNGWLSGFEPSRAPRMPGVLALAGGYPCCCTDEEGGSTSSTPSGSTSSGSSLFSGSTRPIVTVTCQFCDPDTLSEYYQLEIEGVVNGLNCADCDALNGVYLVGPMQQVSVGGSPVDCSQAMATAPVCAADLAQPDCYHQLRFSLFRQGSNYQALVDFQTGAPHLCATGGGAPRIDWLKDLGVTRPDCLFDALSVPFFQHVSTVRCDASSSTVTITAIPPP